MAQCQPVPLAEDVAWILSTHLVAHNHRSAPLSKDPSSLPAFTATAYMLYTDTQFYNNSWRQNSIRSKLKHF